MSVSQALVRGWAATLLACCACAFVSCSAKEEESKGTEGAACYENGTCNAGLSCASNRCVRLPDGTGGGQGAAGAGMTGGNQGAGGAGMTGGNQGSSGAGMAGGSQGSGGAGASGATGGAPPTDGAPGGSGGSTGSGASAGSSGSGGREWGECLAPSTAHTNCDGYCASIGETCAGCPETTMRAWIHDNVGFCQASVFPDARWLSDGCSRTFEWADNAGPLWSNIQCCCTKTR